MEALDETNFDVIIVGTGMTEAILSGAIARIGKKVLHIDSNEFYGDYTASFTLSALETLMTQTTPIPKSTEDELFGAPADSLKLLNGQSGFIEHERPSKEEAPAPQNAAESESISTSSNIPTAEAEVVSADTSQDNGASTKTETLPPAKIELKSFKQTTLDESRHYNIDLSPKVQFSSGPEVELLVSSGVARYLEFKPIEGVYLYSEGDLQQVPCSKGDVFKNKFISLMEKRQLSKFITFIRNEIEGPNPEEQGEQEEQSANNNIPMEGKFVDFLKAHSLTPKLISFVLYSISFLNADQNSEEMNAVSTKEGMELIKRFVKSIGRYGNTPFIASLYGLGEFCQAYCRLSAVYGGIFMLRKGISKIITAENLCTGVVDSDGQNLTCATLVANVVYAPKFADHAKSTNISRCVCVVDQTLKRGEKQLVLVIPPNTFGNKHAIKVMQYSSEMAVCAKQKYLVHFTTVASGTAREDLETAVQKLLKFTPEYDEKLENRPHVLYYAFFNYVAQVPREGSDMPANIFLCSNPAADIDASKSVEEARKIFNSIYPDQQFLPKAHEEDDLVWDEAAQ
eukprot:TRINITY_DN3063_c0_g1_i1.p1 TRINITY_DN3063_c0_g1~~TRINITY_DN3063_c0_g1_i1.p1  ORF type:complete len:594 (+),score=126.98 TRINITY_DN3063_c0_g1_i1:76-1782(+)